MCLTESSSLEGIDLFQSSPNDFFFFQEVLHLLLLLQAQLLWHFVAVWVVDFLLEVGFKLLYLG